MKPPAAAAHLFPPDRADLIRSGRRDGIRFVLDQPAWASLAGDRSPRADAVPLLALWGDRGGQVHALFHDGRARPLVASVAVEAGRYYGLSATIAAAEPFERMVRDLWGFEAMHAADGRSLLDHGLWGTTAPMSSRPGPGPRQGEPPEWRPVAAGEEVALVERGPVGLPWASGGRLRVAVAGPVARAVELQVGYGHRGLLERATGRTPERAARVAERVSAGSVVAHATGFARAVEAATVTVVPVRGALLREMAGEVERAASFLACLSECARSTGARRLAAEALILLERVRVAASLAFGHRFGAGLVVPGGVSRDLDGQRVEALRGLSALIERDWPAIARLYDAADGLGRRLGGVAVVTAAQAASAVASGPVGRASGQRFDARRGESAVPVEVVWAEGGDADARMRGRLAGVEQAGRRLAALSNALPSGPVRVGLGPAGGEGLGVAELPEGDGWHFVRLEADGTVAAWFVRDPSVGHLGLFERSCGGVAVEDVEAVLWSFGVTAEAVEL